MNQRPLDSSKEHRKGRQKFSETGFIIHRSSISSGYRQSKSRLHNEIALLRNTSEGGIVVAT
jgi:hypothetical protein